ncbi:ACT domain-containing protein [Pseudoxanthomonas sp. SE1]|uniref:ACT domain-containing protein n=1 Tax=Pseudoxanthomonas sp. SE1 TaxID=1664560 RepID=UPI00240D79EF|nr:ACT domain-containing protein [Pseudoxanthomonas sp. SE1]WFC42651.1 ACT domain-containing protein [Pseudoxanthomonas sp. SE1]
MTSLALALLPGRYAVAQLPADSALPAWWPNTGMRHAGWTDEELSLVCEEAHVPEDVRCQRGWRMFKLQGPFDFALTGILEAVLDPLAAAGVGIFALSTYDTDYVLVQAPQLDEAVSALRDAGHRIDA